MNWYPLAKKSPPIGSYINVRCDGATRWLGRIRSIVYVGGGCYTFDTDLVAGETVHEKVEWQPTDAVGLPLAAPET